MKYIKTRFKVSSINSTARITSQYYTLLRHDRYDRYDRKDPITSRWVSLSWSNLLPVYYLTHFEDCGGKMCLRTKFHANRTIFGEVITFPKFSRWRPARSRDITICNAGPHTKSPRCSELAVQIWFQNLDYFWIYRNFSFFVTLHVKCLTTPTFWWILGALTPKI